MNAKPMRLVERREKGETRQQKALREIHERLKTPEFGMGKIDNAPTANYLPVDEIQDRSFKKV